MTKAEQLKQHQKNKSRIYAMTDLDDNTTGEALDEGLVHLVEHFNPVNKNPYDRDYVFVMGKSYLGTNKEDPDHKCFYDACFSSGDMHEWAHDLAGYMRDNPKIRDMVFHAFFIYATGPGRG